MYLVEHVPTMFSIKLHHGGNFTKLPNTKYVKGEVGYIDLVDIDEFLVHELDAMMLARLLHSPSNILPF